MNAQNGFTPLQIRQFYRHPPVEPSRPQEGGIQGFGPVGRRQDDDAFLSVKAVHFRQQLIQRLFPLIVAANSSGAVPLLADGIDLVNKHDAGRLLIGLLEQIPHLGGAHAHEHLHKLAAADGEEGNLRFTGHRLGQQRFSRAGGAYQQGALGEFGADPGVLVRMLQEIHNLLQRILGFFLSGHVRKGDAGLLVRHDPGVGLPEVQGVHAAAHTLAQLIAQQPPQAHENRKGQKPGQDQAEQGIVLGGNPGGKPDARLLQPVDQPVIRKNRRAAKLLLAAVIRRHKENLV